TIECQNLAVNRHKLLAEILDGQGHPLGALLESWLTSKRFAAFVGDHTTKIRKKLRTATDEGSLRDLLLELDVAFRLTQDKRFSLIYEPVQQRRRGADLAVRFTTQTVFMVEVTRLKEQARLELDASRLAGALTLKLGQFMNATPNALVIG